MPPHPAVMLMILHLKKCLFGAVTLTKNADIDKYEYFVMELDLIEEEVFHF